MSASVAIQLKRSDYINRKVVLNVIDATVESSKNDIHRFKPSWSVAMTDKA